MEFIKVVKDKSISLQAKGLLALMIMLEEEDDCEKDCELMDVADCLKEASAEEGRRFAKEAFKELAKAGVLSLEE